MPKYPRYSHEEDASVASVKERKDWFDIVKKLKVRKKGRQMIDQEDKARSFKNLDGWGLGRKGKQRIYL